MFCLQSAYLVGIADPASQPGRPGLVDQSQFARANQAIQMACSNLTNPASSQQQVKKKKKKLTPPDIIYVILYYLECLLSLLMPAIIPAYPLAILEIVA